MSNTQSNQIYMFSFSKFFPGKNLECRHQEISNHTWKPKCQNCHRCLQRNMLNWKFFILSVTIFSAKWHFRDSERDKICIPCSMRMVLLCIDLVIVRAVGGFTWWTLIHVARFMGPTWGPPGTDRTQVGPMLAPWTLLSGYFLTSFM